MTPQPFTGPEPDDLEDEDLLDDEEVEGDGGQPPSGEPTAAQLMQMMQQLQDQLANAGDPELAAIDRRMKAGIAGLQAAAKGAKEAVKKKREDDAKAAANEARDALAGLFGVAFDGEGQPSIIGSGEAPTRQHLDLPASANQRRPVRPLEDVNGTSREETDAEKVARLERELKAEREKPKWKRAFGK